MIEEFFSNPRAFKPPRLPQGHTATIRELDEKCIRMSYQHIEPGTVVHWHRLLVEYAGLPDAILPIRLHENMGPHSNVNGDGPGTRRRSLTICPDGFSYAFSSNSFARAIYSMVVANRRPTVDEFGDLMRRFEMRIGFHWKNESADEDLIAAYPVAYPRKFYLDGWYLAHIHGMGDESYHEYEDIDLEKIFPAGIVADWNVALMNNRNVPVRRISSNLSERAKVVARAHFLRFLDPLNYFLVPNLTHVTYYPRTCRMIGEEPLLRDYMDSKRRVEFGECYEEFCRLALIEQRADDLFRLGSLPLSVTFGKMSASDQLPDSRTEMSPRCHTSMKLADDTEIVLNPSSAEEFKRRLLLSQHANRRLVYADGTVCDEVWNASAFTTTSDLLCNIKTSAFWRTRRASGLVRVEFTVE